MRATAIAPRVQVELFSIADSMQKSGLADEFVAAAVRTAIAFEGVSDLMKMWAAEADESERAEIVADIQDMIDDCAQQDSQEAAYVRFNDLARIASDIRSFKDGLLIEVTKRGGMKALSELTGIPQPSLSRFFGTTSMPRRATLFKIAKALKLDAVKVATEWSR